MLEAQIFKDKAALIHMLRGGIIKPSLLVVILSLERTIVPGRESLLRVFVGKLGVDPENF